MCDFSGPFKLCTCSDKIDKSKPWWELRRRKIKKPQELVIGSVPAWSFPMFIDVDFVLKQLNSVSVFDFDYKPRTHDQLIIHNPGDESLVLHYQWGRWTRYRRGVGVMVMDEKLLHTGTIEN